MSESEVETISVEDQASMVGWKEGGTKSAQEFIDARDSHMGLQREDIKKLERRGAEQDAVIASMAKTLESTRVKATEQGYNQAIAEAKETMRKAVEDADTEAYKVAEEKVEKLEDEREKEVSELTPIAPASDNVLEAQVTAHMEKHPEIFSNHFQTTEWGNAIRFHGKNGMSLDDAMVQADKDIVSHFKLGKSLPGPGGDESISTKSGGDLKFSDLNKADQQAYYSFAKDLDGYTKEQYMEVYNGS